MNTLKLALFLICSTGYLRYISRQPGIGPYKAPFLYCCFVSLCLFFFAIVGQLTAGLFVVTALGFCLFAHAVWSTPFTAFLPSFLPRHNISYLIAFPFVAYYVAIQSDFKFLLWDEFSFWLSSTRFIFETNALFTESSPIYVKSYPPLQQLFQYFFTTFTSWSEKHVLYAQTLWVLSGLLCMLGSLIKSPLHITAGFLISCTFLYFFGYSFSTIYSDPLLGVVFAACVALALDARRGSSTMLAFCIGIAALVLLKEIAVLLAAVAIVVFALNRPYTTNSSAATIIDYLKSLALAVGIPLISVALVLRLWAWYVAEIKASRATLVPNLVEFFNGPLRDRLVRTFNEFLIRLLKSDYVAFFDHAPLAGPSILSVFILVSVCSVILVFCHTDTSRIKRALSLLILLGGAVGYMFALLASYMVFFTEYEGVRLASFERYLSSYMLAWILITYALCIAKLETFSNVYSIASHFAIALAALYLVPQGYLKELKSIRAEGPVFQLRQDIESFSQRVKRHLQKNEQVYFISQNSNGLERVIFYYSMLPYRSSMSWCWSLGKKYFDGDVWTCDVTLNSLIGEYEYLAVYRGDKNLVNAAKDILGATGLNKSSTLFKIDRSNGTIRLIEIID